MTARHFTQKATASSSTRPPTDDFGPIILGTGSAVLFFVGSAFGLWQAGWSWVLTIAVVAIASIWGWRTLDSDLQRRLKGIPGRLMGF